MSKYHPHNLTQAGLLIALGILIPFVTGHAFGVQGTVLLPMHFTVLLAGFLLGPFWGAVIGVLTPLISSVLTGMPPAFPMLPLMIGELGTYGWATGHFWNRGGGCCRLSLPPWCWAAWSGCFWCQGCSYLTAKPWACCSLFLSSKGCPALSSNC